MKPKILGDLRILYWRFKVWEDGEPTVPRHTYNPMTGWYIWQLPRQVKKECHRC